MYLKVYVNDAGNNAQHFENDVTNNSLSVTLLELYTLTLAVLQQ